MYRWTKYVNDWAVREVPGVGRGAVAGYAGGIVDRVISALIDLVWGFPVILVAVIFVGALNPGLKAVILACPGATPEYFPAKGCFIQIWTNEATMSVYTECVLGLRPDAARKKLLLRPCIPMELGVLHLENLFIGDARFSFDFSPDTQTLTVTAPMEWELTLEHPQIRLQRQINP